MHQWKERLHNYARGNFTFLRGQKPAPASRWGKELANMNSCPKHKTTHSTDVFGKAIVCQCRHHHLLPPPSRRGSSIRTTPSSSQARQSIVQRPSTSTAVELPTPATSHVPHASTSTAPAVPAQPSTSSTLPCPRFSSAPIEETPLESPPSKRPCLEGQTSSSDVSENLSLRDEVSFY